MLTFGVVLLYDSAHLLTASRTRALLKHFSWELFDRPLYSPYLAPSDYHQITNLKNLLESQHFDNNELMEGVKTWLSSQVAGRFPCRRHTNICCLIRQVPQFLW
jgi:hypothetical protein